MGIAVKWDLIYLNPEISGLKVETVVMVQKNCPRQCDRGPCRPPCYSRMSFQHAFCDETLYEVMGLGRGAMDSHLAWYRW